MGQCRTYPQKPLSKEGSEGLSVIVGGLGWARLVIPSHFWLVGWAMESLQFKEVRDWPWSSEKGRQAGPGKHPLYLLFHLLVFSCIFRARLTTPLRTHSLSPPASEPLLPLVHAPIGIFSLCATCPVIHPSPSCQTPFGSWNSHAHSHLRTLRLAAPFS